MRTGEFRIAVGGETIACSVDHAADGSAPRVLDLHGGGPSHRGSAAYLSETFVGRGLGVVRFDFSGQGESTGLMARSSLRKRRDEALAVARHFGMRDGLTVVGTSMGGYVASSLVPELDVARLILFCPAAYSARARDVEFGAGFTEIIRAERSYDETDLDDLLGGYSGPSLLVMGTEDEIIPQAVTDRYVACLGKSGRLSRHDIEGCPHPIHRWSEPRPEVRAAILRAVIDFIDAD